MDFFSKIESKFKEQFVTSGRYIENIIEAISDSDPRVILPIIRKAGFSQSRIGNEWHARSEIYISNNRIADLYLERECDKSGLGIEISVEIKIHDAKSASNIGQIEDYIDWVSNAPENIKRHAIILSAFELTENATRIVKQSKNSITYYSFYEYVSELSNGGGSNLIAFFTNYLAKKGFSVDSISRDDAQALKSFLVLNFLPHTSGFGKVSQYKNISAGPEVFGKIVRNWQLFNSDLASRKMTTRYIPAQFYNSTNSRIADSNFDDRRFARSNKSGGCFWIFSDCVLDANNFRLEIGLKLMIDKQDQTIAANMYGLVRNRVKVYSEKEYELKGFFATHHDVESKNKNFFSNLRNLRNTRTKILCFLSDSFEANNQGVPDVAEKLKALANS